MRTADAAREYLEDLDRKFIYVASPVLPDGRCSAAAPAVT